MPTRRARTHPRTAHRHLAAEQAEPGAVEDPDVQAQRQADGGPDGGSHQGADQRQADDSSERVPDLRALHQADRRARAAMPRP